MAVTIRRQALWTLGALVAAAASPAAARGQDQPPPPPAPRGTARAPERFADPTRPDFLGAVLGDDSVSEIVPGSDERVILAVGGLSQPVWLRFPGFELRCDSAVLWGDRERMTGVMQNRAAAAAATDDLLGNVIHAVYAEGQVFVRRGGQTFHASRALLDFQTHRAYLVDVVLEDSSADVLGRKVPLSIRASVIRGVGRDRYRAENAVFTSCTYQHPHLAFETSRIEVDFSKKQPEYETSWWPTVRADTLVAENVPLLPIPKLGGDLGGRPVQAVEFSNSGRMGFTLGLGFGGRLDREDGSTWGTWQVMPRYRSRRGAGLGFEVEHEGEDRPGGTTDAFSVEGEYQRDKQDEDSFSERPFDGQAGGDSDANRGRVHLWSRQSVENGLFRDLFGEGWRLDAEASWLSDRGYLPEYDSDAANQDKPQETYLQLRRVRGNQGISGLASYRLSDEAYALDRRPGDPMLTTYAYQTDALPSLTWHLVNQPVLAYERTGFAPLNLSVEASAAHLERRYDDTYADRLERTTGWTSKGVLRGDLETRVTAPFEAGPVHVTPAFGGSVYHVSDANGFANAGTPDADDREGRGALFWNLRAGSEASRVYGAQSDLLDLDGLRHVVSADADWFSRFRVTDDTPQEFQTNDLHDQLFEQNVVSFRLRNRLQTKREGAVADWFDYEARFLYYVERTDAYAGTGLGVREDFASPLERLDFPGEEKYLAATREGSAFHQHRARVELRPDLWLVGEADYDMTLSEMESTGAGFRWFPSRKFSLYVGRRAIHDDSAVWTVRGDYRLSDKWGFSGEFQEDTKANRGLRTRLGLFRRGHDLTFALEFESERLLDETGIAFVVYPHDWLVRGNDPFSQRRPLDFEALRWYR